jgi:CRISPR/Cas system CMR-associated protein Cmr1 (group 7 of RAMP superfamily)
MKIIGISGRKQAGKNTAANYINGKILQNLKMVEDSYIDNNGQLVIKTTNSSDQSDFGIFDVTRKDEIFVQYAERELWPYIKVYHFADPLKEMASNLFDLDEKLIYGSNEDKDTKTPFVWSSVPMGDPQNNQNMSIREFLEYFGTKIIRKIKNDAWAEFTIKRIVRENSNVAIIPDVRFPNEVLAIQAAGGKVIRLTRDKFNSSAEAESALDKDVFDWSQFDAVIENNNISIQELCDELNKINNYWS